MDVIGFEKCRVVRFASAFRPQGALFAPEAFAKIIARYSFAKYPTLDDLQKDGPTIFQFGKFQDVQIDEFGIYADGYSAASRCSTQVLDDFLNDLSVWATQEFGLMFILPHRNETHYESNIVVVSSTDLASIVHPNASQALAGALTKATGLRYAPSGVVFDCDPVEVNASNTRKKPWRLFIERRAGFPFRENMFLCQAPISTPEHVVVLQALEQAVVENRI